MATMVTTKDVEMTHTSKGEAEANVIAEDYDEVNGAARNHRTAFEPTQRLDRYINFIPTIAFGANLQASWESVAVSFQAGLLNGGPTSLLYGTVLAWIGSIAIAMSLAELASITPTVGAQYRWAGLYAPPGIMSPAFWGLLQGWMTVFAWIATCAQPAFLLGTTIQGLLVLNDVNYVFHSWHGTLLAWAILAIPVVSNIFARRFLPTLEVIGGVTHIVFFIAIVVTLAVLAPRSTASYVFTESTYGLSGWTNQGVQWNVGLLSAVFPLVGFDGVLHMSDEVKDAPRKVPRSMVYSIIINGGMALAFMICILFTLGDPATALATPTGYPIIQVLYGATQSYGATTALMCFIIWNGIIAMFSSMASVSRLTWAFARDHGLPFPEFFGYVHPQLRIPLNSLALVAVVIALLQLINIGSSTALFAILSLSTMALYLSYILPIVFIVLWKFRRAHIPYGPWHLGKFGLPINIFAIVYGIYIVIWLPFPPYLPVTAVNMNYGGPVVGFVILFALLDWFTWGKKRFHVPVDWKHENDE